MTRARWLAHLRRWERWGLSMRRSKHLNWLASHIKACRVCPRTPPGPALRTSGSLATTWAQAAAQALEKARHHGDRAEYDEDPRPPRQIVFHVVPLLLAAIQVMLPRAAPLVRARPHPLLDVRGARFHAALVRGRAAAGRSPELRGGRLLGRAVSAALGQERPSCVATWSHSCWQQSKSCCRELHPSSVHAPTRFLTYAAQDFTLHSSAEGLPPAAARSSAEAASWGAPSAPPLARNAPVASPAAPAPPRAAARNKSVKRKAAMAGTRRASALSCVGWAGTSTCAKSRLPQHKWLERKLLE
eukprot:CAMPEP_0198605696 /NCGR_PEP_ID=MMETSP1462-20131121/154525_1 /TAXON_ID=1333877 /ORGANISM="Brandtodinium nutriculum, Strain RCC3387" /LENGTH=300 /DNA_ID=CAMNT_0044337499 /DNA_START=34 /DNA_END=933 /DNA_ORIENTATION=+